MKRPEEYEMARPVSEAEKTLRLIANAPAPDGLVERVQTGLETAPRARVLHWPLNRMPGGWMASPALRAAAAVAIVCVVAGGGWRIYSHVQAPTAAKVVTMPARVGTQGGFSSAGAMRTPDALAGPVLTHAVNPDAAGTQAGKQAGTQARTPARTPARRHKTPRAATVPAPVPPR